MAWLEGILCPCEPPLAHLGHLLGAGLACPCLLPPHIRLLPFVELLPRLLLLLHLSPCPASGFTLW